MNVTSAVGRIARWTAAGALLVSLSTATLAQEMPEWAAPSAPRERPVATERAPEQVPPDFPDLPLDPTGLALLVVAGGALAARHLRRTD
jgi:hypothetical protein